MSKKNTKKKEDIFTQEYQILKSAVKRCEVSIDVIGKYAYEYDEQSTKKIEQILKKASKKSYQLSKEDVSLIFSETKKHPVQGPLFCRNTIVSIVSMLDNVFSVLFKFYFKENPGALSLENQELSFAELKKISSVSDARDFLIEREITKILLQKGISERLKALKKDIHINTPDDEKVILEIKKLIKTRNLIIHNNGCVDSEYAKICKGSQKKGDYLQINEEYLKKSLYLVLFVSGFVLQSAQTKFVKDKIKSEDFILNDVMHALLKRGEFGYLKQLYNVSEKSSLDDLNKKMVVINFCIGLKEQKKSKQHIEKVLAKEDWSVVSDEFVLALHALRDNDEEFYKLLDKLLTQKKIGKAEIGDWKIFTPYRNKIKFRKLVKKAL